MKKCLFWIEDGELNKQGLDLFDYEQVIAYEMNDNGRPIKEIGRIKLK